MRYTIPDYYREFHCTADRCEDTCCAGWQIVVDDLSLHRYKAVRNDFRKQLRKGVDWKQKVFRQKEDRRCAFLNDRNLCDMYTALGEKSLCRTCRRYPRHIEEFENVREITLSVSCPEVAKILMNREKPVRMISVDTEEKLPTNNSRLQRRKQAEQECFEEFDDLLYSQLLDARDVIRGILQDRSLPLAVREKLVYGIGNDMQNRIDKQELFACQDVFAKYQKPQATAFVKKKLQQEAQDAEGLMVNAMSIFRGMFLLEVLKPEWDMQLLEVENYLYLGHSAQEYAKITQDFDKWISDSGLNWENRKEQLIVYFIDTYFCGAVYDGRAFAKVKMALCSAFIIEEILKSRWIKNDRMLDMEDIIDVVYRFSRETEHSDENLEWMDVMF